MACEYALVSSMEDVNTLAAGGWCVDKMEVVDGMGGQRLVFLMCLDEDESAMEDSMESGEESVNYGP